MPKAQLPLWPKKRDRQVMMPPASANPVGVHVISYGKLPDKGTPLAILGDDSGARYSLHSLMECGGEFTYALIMPFAQRSDPWADRKVILLNRLAVA